MYKHMYAVMYTHFYIYTYVYIDIHIHLYIYTLRPYMYTHIDIHIHYTYTKKNIDVEKVEPPGCSVHNLRAARRSTCTEVIHGLEAMATTCW